MKTKTKKQKINDGGIIGLLLIATLAVAYFGITTLLDKIAIKSAWAARYTQYPAEMCVLSEVNAKKPREAVEGQKTAYQYNDQIPSDIIIREIKNQAKKFSISEQLMLDIAECESTYNNLAENKNSSAEGIYQFTYGTWRTTESGRQHISRFDYQANIREASIKIAAGEYSHWVDCLK